MPKQVTGLYGSIWNGRANLTGGYTFNWVVRGWPLVTARGVTDWTLEGIDTQVTGVVRVSPWSLRATEIVGRAGPGLLNLVPDSPVKNCTSLAVMDVQELSWARGAAAAAGVVTVDPDTCEDFLGRPINLPKMTLDLSTQGNDALAILRDSGGRLAQATIAGDRRLILRVEPEGAALVPGLPAGGPMVIEYPF